MFVIKDSVDDIFLLPFDPKTSVIDWIDDLEKAAKFPDEETAQMMFNYLFSSFSDETEIWEIIKDGIELRLYKKCQT